MEHFEAREIFRHPLLAVDDFNGDNIADLLISRGDVSVQLGRGDGTFRSSVLGFVVGGFQSLWVSSMVMAVRISRQRAPAGVSVALGYGDGTFQTTWNYILGGGIAIRAPIPPGRRCNCRARRIQW